VVRVSEGITLRELYVLRWTAEQYALPMAVVAELVRARYGVSPVAERYAVSPASAPRVAARVAERLARLGYADRRRALGRWWLSPSRHGMTAADLPYRLWVLDDHAWSLAHVVAVARLRLYLERTYPTATWESERHIRHRWWRSGAHVRLADGGLHWSDDQTATGIELERYVKAPGRYRGAVMDADPAWNAGVWWFTPAGQVDLLTARLRDAGGSDRHQVYPLPEGVAW
jgi:hypothetical protein